MKHLNPLTRLAGMGLALALGATLTACGEDSTEATADGLTKVRIGQLPSMAHVPPEIAAREGMLESAGISAEVTPLSDYSALATSLGRQFDWVICDANGVAAANAQGIDIQVLSGLSRSSPEAIANALVATDENIQSAGDLEGKNVAVVTLGGATVPSLLLAAEQEGADPNSITPVVAGMGTHMDQLAADRVDGSVTSNPNYVSAVQSGDAHIVADVQALATGTDTPATSMLCTTSKWAEEHPDLIEPVRTAMAEAIEWMDANEDEVRSYIQEWVGYPQEIAENAPLTLFDASFTEDDFLAWKPVIEYSGEVTLDNPSELIVQ